MTKLKLTRKLAFIEHNEGISMRSLSILLALGFITGCSMMPTKKTVVEPVYEAPIDPILVKMSQSAARIETAVINLNAVNTAAKLPNISAKQREQMESDNQYAPEGLTALVTVPHYDGPVETFVQQIANQVGGGWRWGGVQGVKPALDLSVNKQYTDVPVISVLQDLGYSIKGATIIVDNRSKTISIRYIGQ